MESRFIELAKTDLSEKDFFEEVFSSYIHYLYKSKSGIKDLSRIRKHFIMDDPHTQKHLRDQIESVMYRHNSQEHETANLDKLEMKKKIEQLEEKIDRLEGIMNLFLYQETK
jgi:hypothetical protein